MNGEPIQEFFSIGEVCELTGLKPHVLRYWESQFRALHPAKNRSGNRVYQRREVELIQFVKHLLYEEKYTIDGARQRLEAARRGGDLRGAAREALGAETVRDLELGLQQVLDVLAGRPPRESPDPSSRPNGRTARRRATADGEG